MANTLNYLGNIATDKGKYKLGRWYHLRSLEIREQLGEPSDIAASLINIGEAAFFEDDQETAQAHLRRGLEYLQGEKANLRWKANCHELLARIALDKDDDVRASEKHHKQAIKIRSELKDKTFIPYSLEGYAAIAQRQGQTKQAIRLLGAAESLREFVKHPLPFSYEEKHHQLIKALRAHVEEETFKAAWKAGRGLKYEEAVRCAIDGH